MVYVAKKVESKDASFENTLMLAWKTFEINKH